MTEFNQAYYDGIWGTVHRHDYCEHQADRLIQQYGKVRILDIGTGCGELVRVLREKGCEAWGLDVSPYAAVNSCAPQWVRLGDVRNIPWAANSFDVVHSNGLWGYFPEEDVQTAWAECRRVGTIQAHNYDIDDDEPSHQLVLVRGKAWWAEQFLPPKVLVATSVHACKAYSMQRWIDRVKSFTYQNYDMLAVDNSPDESVVRQFENQLDIRHIDVPQDPQLMYQRITKSMALIQQEFLRGKYHWWFNLECDVIPPTDIIEFMLHWGRDSDWIAHCYPNRDSKSDVQQGIGCAMLSRRLAEAFDFRQADSPDAWLWEQVRHSGRFRTMELWQYVPVEHLAS